MLPAGPSSSFGSRLALAVSAQFSASSAGAGPGSPHQQRPPNGSRRHDGGGGDGHQRHQRRHHYAHRDDAPMTPVVYLVLWTSVAVGALRGYAVNATTAARWSPAFSYALNHNHRSAAMAASASSPYCSPGVDVSRSLWYETFLSVAPPPVACILGAVFIRHSGRTRAVMLGCVIMIAGQVLMASATTMVQLAVAMATVQSASNILSVSIIMQTVEVAPRARRGTFLLVHMCGVALGVILVSVIGYVIAAATTLGWRLLLGMGVIPALAVLLVMPWMVDTPQSLIERGKYAEGLAALRDIRGPFYEDTYGEYMSIVAAAAAAPKGFMMYAELFRNRRYLPAICVGMVMALLAIQLDPQSRSYVAYNTLIRADVAPKDAVLMTVVTLSVTFALGTIVAMLVVDRVGRLPLLRLSSLLGIAIIAVLAIGGFLVTRTVSSSGETHHDNRWPYIQLGALGVLAGGNGLAWSSVVWVIISESQALAVRPAGMALCLAVANLSASVLETQLLCILQLRYYVFVLCISFLALAVACLLLPETSKVSLEDITDLYLHHWLWRRLVNGKGSSSGAAAGPSGRAGSRYAPRPHHGGGSGLLPPVAARDSASSGGASSGGSSFFGGPRQQQPPPPAAAAAASDLPGYARQLSPFGRKDVQLAAAAAAAGPAAAAAGPAAAGGLGPIGFVTSDSGGGGQRHHHHHHHLHHHHYYGSGISAAVAAATSAAAAAAASLGVAASGALSPGGSGGAAGGSGQLQQALGGSGGGAGSGGGSGLLPNAWSLRGPGWLGGLRRGSQQPADAAAAGRNTLDDLAEELREDV